ncbi:MAG TPA: helix-turn-helix domain-containing protein [Thermoleophilaceae bacterium]|nr:helix-turn-helix domain-containing protein [Thermoleophilaceae bacterium]
MPSIGETLREARMRQRLDIADVEERTKIRAKYLRALENEEFSMLPGPTFVKTFLRTYSEALGVDPHPLVEEYRARHEPGDELEHIQSLGPPTVGRERRRGRRRGGPGTLALLVAVGVVCLLVAIGLLTDSDGDGTGERAATEPTEQTAPSTETEPSRRQRPRRVVLRIAPTAPTYACLDRGPGKRVLFEGVLSEPATFRGRRLRLNLGKTDVRLRVNRRPVTVAPGPNPVGFVFTPRGRRALPLGERPCA